MKPQVLLLDEPTNGLDIDSKQRLIEEINKIDAAKIIISHDPEMLSSTCTKFATIRNCRIESIAKPEMHEHWHTHFYGGVPHTTVILHDAEFVPPLVGQTTAFMTLP